jgi:hypothetical protein
VRGQVLCKRLRLKGLSMPIRISDVTPVRRAMRVILGAVGMLVALMGSVIARLRQRDPSGEKPSLGSISGSWLSEYDAKERQGGS